MVDVSAVQNIIGSWWFDYDHGHFDVWPDYFTEDAHFECRSDSGESDVESLFNADVNGRDDVIAWQIEHRRNSPFPLRHNGTNIHITSASGNEAAFRSYLFVTKILDGAVANVATAVCLGRVREEDGGLRFSDLRVIIDFANSDVFIAAVQVVPPGL